MRKQDQDLNPDPSAYKLCALHGNPHRTLPVRPSERQWVPHAPDGPHSQTLSCTEAWGHWHRRQESRGTEEKVSTELACHSSSPVPLGSQQPPRPGRSKKGHVTSHLCQVFPGGLSHTAPRSTEYNGRRPGRKCHRCPNLGKGFREMKQAVTVGREC